MRRLAIFAALVGSLLATLPAAAEVWRIASEEGYPPYNYTDPSNGRPTGLDVELVTTILNDAKVEYELKMVPWERLKRLLDAGQVDLAFQFLDTPERRARYLLVGPFREGKLVFACRKGCRIPFKQLADLKPYRIATVFGYAYGSEFEQAGLTVDNTATRSDMLPAMLAVGRVDLIVGDQLLLQALALQQGLQNKIEFLDTPLSIQPRYVGFRQGGEAMAERFAKSLAKLRADGTLEQIIQRWSNRKAPRTGGKN
ncbi:amino acid ABC transporter substrate-binding protein [Chitinimonas arctica]|uniref:Amino acid ABC transporter substrate-binding protein n=1 Tax=Chitinimonas arctica TaxID=2594795 RepID=A0A516SK49_9NEIS|nr:transporter substrate-binding domain-containing protein [Chitinimonas arctica]QDQ28524.1 amino acid ABC transporter substrate-binding protein [Chitinimonas arctica]